MKRERFTEEQIAFAVCQAEARTSVEEICRKLGCAPGGVLAPSPVVVLPPCYL
jgi:hypothetical protein